MNRRWTYGWLAEPAALVAALSVTLVLSTAACPRAPQALPVRSIERDGVKVVALNEADVPSGPLNAAAAGDWLLRAPGLSAVVARESSRHAGQLLDLSSGTLTDDALDALEVILEVDGRATPSATKSVRPVETARGPGVRIVQQAGALRLTTDLVPLSDGSLSLDTAVTSSGGAHRVRVGDRLQVFGRAPFAPGLGFVEGRRRTSVDWLARPSNAQSYVLARERGQLDVAFEVGLRGPVEQRAWSETALLSGEFRYRRRLFVSGGGLGKVLATVGRARGEPTGLVEGTLSEAPKWATITAFAEDGSGPRAAVDADGAGRFAMALPAGKYRLELVAPGGRDSRALRVDAERTTKTGMVVPKPATLSYEVSDSAGRPLPARLLLSGQPPTPHPNLGPPYLAAGAGRGTYSATGRGHLQLPPGKYSVQIMHGPEYSLVTRDVEVDAQRGAVLRASLERVVDQADYVACDFHVHAEPSGDSDVPLADRVASLVAENIGFAVATDHNHITDYEPAVHTLELGERFASMPGVELTTVDWGHFNAFPAQPGAALPPLDTTPDVLFARARELFPGAVIQINHPRMEPKIGYFSQGELDPQTLATGRAGFSWDFDTLEVLNGFELGDPARIDANFVEWQRLLAHGRRVTAVGNSDSHQLAAQWVGYPRTYVRVPKDTPRAELATRVAAALRAGRAVVSNGPFVLLDVAGGAPGDVVSSDSKPVRARVRVRAAPWVDVSRVELWVNGALLKTLKVPVSQAVERFVAEEMISLERDGWVIAVVRGDKALPVLPDVQAPPLAFTNPVLVDVDGDGLHALAGVGPSAAAGATEP